MRIESVKLTNLPPFERGSTITFPASTTKGKLAEVHLLTGPNGSGKSRLLAMLAGSTPVSAERIKSSRLAPGIDRSIHRTGTGKEYTTSAGEWRIAFSISPRTPLAFAFKGGAFLEHSNLEVLKGVELPSDNERLSFTPWVSSNISQRMANLKVQAALDHLNETSGRPLIITKRLEEVISQITGEKFSVIAATKPRPSLLFSWGEGKFSTGGLPDGLNSLLSWMFAAATYMDLTHTGDEDPLSLEAIFFLDEPETHLHPEWQRRIMPMAQALFPNSQFFVATHSPFIVSSVNEGFIYKLERKGPHTIKISDAEPASSGDSYVSALADILGVKEWFDPETENLLSQFRKLRDVVLSGDKDQEQHVRELAVTIGKRSEELSNLMGLEIRQLNRLLEKSH